MAGKYSTPKKRHLAPFVVILAVAALVATIGGSMAWLTDKSDKNLVNTFTPADVKVKVVEAFDDNKKTSIAVENTGDADVYVRVALVSNWGNMITKSDSEDEWVVCGDGSHEHRTFAFDDTTLGAGWVKIREYYYYTTPVKPGEANATGNLLPVGKTIEVSGENDGCKQQVTVLVQAVQAEPATAINQAWGIALDTDDNPVFTN